MTIHRRFRDAIRGTFTTRQHAQANPDTTIAETRGAPHARPNVDHFDPTDVTRVWIPEGAESFLVHPTERTIRFEFRDEA